MPFQSAALQGKRLKALVSQLGIGLAHGMVERATLQDLLRDFAAKPQHTAVIGLGAGTRWDYAELAETVSGVAAGLLAAGVARGERVGLLAPNGAEWIAAALGTIVAGAVIVPIDGMLGRDDLAHVVADSGLRWIFAASDRVAQLRELSEHPLEILRLDGDAGDSAGQTWRSLLSAVRAPLPGVGPEDIAAQFYTSGTSGRPKGVPLTHGNIVANIEALLQADLVAPDERACLPLPLFHVYPFVVGMLTPLAAGATLILPAGVSGPEIAQALKEERATALIGVPRLYDALVGAIRHRVGSRSKRLGRVFDGLLALSAGVRQRRGWRLGRTLFAPIRRSVAPDLRLLVSGGAKLEPDVAGVLEGLGWEVLTGYGLTETSPIVTFNRRGRARLDTAGQPLPGIELQIDEPDDNGIGEVVVRGPNVFRGYHNLPEQSSEVVSPNGWFRTGDLGRLDGEGYLRLTGRRSAVIVLPGGKKLDPEALEESYAAHPAIREVGILLEASRLVALVVPANPEAGADPVAAAIREISPTLPSYRRVTDFALAAQPLPRTSLGKIRRFQLAELFAAAKQGRAAARPQELSPEDKLLLQAEPARRVWDLLRTRFPDKPVGMDANLQLDLGIDSLEWIGLSLELQQAAGVRLTEEALAKVTTVRDLLQTTVAQGERLPDGAAEQPTPDQSSMLEPPGPALRLLGGVLASLNRAAFVWPFPLTVTGRERVPTSGRVLFTPNHLSFLDPPVLGAALPPAARRKTWWAGFSGLLHSSGIRRACSRAAQVFPVNELSPASSLALGKAVLDRGDNLVWFPEGARSMDGMLQPLMSGIGLLIEQTGATVVPVFIRGTFEAWPRGRSLPRGHPVSVSFGHPLTPDALAEMGEGADQRARIVSGLARALRELGRDSQPGATRNS